MALKTTTVQFTGYFQDIDYTYSFESTSSDPSQITIVMNYIRSMSNPQMRVNIELPSNFIQNYPNDIYIIDNQIALNDITVLSETQKSLSQSTRSVTEATRLVTIISILISSAFAKSFGAVQTLMLINLVFYLKYINIDYPPHMQDLFDSEDFALPFLIFNYNNPNQLILPPPPLITPEYYTDIKSGEDVWLKYKVKLYFLDNFGDKMVQFVIVFVVALIIYKLKHFIVNPKINNIVTKVFDFLCWGWILNFFLTNFRNIFIYVFRVWHYCRGETSFSKFDIFISILVFLIMIISTIHIWNVNWVIRGETIKKKKQEKENEKKQIELQNLEETKIKLKIADDHDQGLMSPSKSPHVGKNEPAGIGMSSTLKTGELKQNEQSEFLHPKSELKQSERFNEKNEDKNEKSAFLVEKSSEITKPQPKKKGGLLRSKQSRGLDAWAAIYTPDELYEKKYILMNNDYDKKHKSTINYVVLFLLRYLGYSLVIVVMNNIPFLQIFLIQYINVIFFIYLVKCRPFESKIKFGFAVIQEIIVIYLYFYPLVLAGYELTGRIFDEDKMLIGDYFLKSYMAFTIVIMVTVVLGIIVTVIENKKKKKLEDAKKKEEEAKKKEEEDKKKEEEDKKKEGDKKKEEEEKNKGEDHKEEESNKKTDKDQVSF